MNEKARKRSKGFTLIELMIVVAIIGILAAVAIPKFADLVTKSKEASTKASLGAVRSALSIYYGDQEGNYPENLFNGLTAGGRYLPVGSLGNFTTPRNSNGHAAGHEFNSTLMANVKQGAALANADDGATNALFYVTGGGTNSGNVVVACSHMDTKSTVWSGY